jgi:hypothetical protein
MLCTVAESILSKPYPTKGFSMGQAIFNISPCSQNALLPG